MLKIKHERECDCVVAGFRWHKKGDRDRIGSLLLGLFNDDGKLQHVGVCASFTDKKRIELVEFLKPYRKDALGSHPWKEWAGEISVNACRARRVVGVTEKIVVGTVRPELVVEVAYEHMQGNRFRHTAHFRRWRTDKKPTDCTYEQLEVVPPHEIELIFGQD